MLLRPVIANRLLSSGGFARPSEVVGWDRLLPLVQSRDLIHELVKKEIVVRYHGSVLGLLWTQLYPLSLLLIYSFLFSTVFHMDVPRFPMFIFVGISLWHFWSSAMTLSSRSVISNTFLIKHVKLPREVVTVVAVLVPGIDLCLAHLIIA